MMCYGEPRFSQILRVFPQVYDESNDSEQALPQGISKSCKSWSRECTFLAENGCHDPRDANQQHLHVSQLTVQNRDDDHTALGREDANGWMASHAESVIVIGAMHGCCHT